MSYDTLRVERDDGVVVVFLNRPDKLNALNRVLRAELISLMDLLSEDPEARVVILTGSGDLAFAAGADVEEFASRTVEEQRRAMLGRRIYDAVAECRKPTIAAVHGHCLGGGLELALACDLRVADATARFAQAEIRLGLIPGGGGSQRLARLIGPGQAFRLTLTGDAIDAAEAHRIGLVEFLVDDGEHREKARALAGRMARWAPGSLELGKRAVRAALEHPLSRGLDEERELFLEAFASEESREAVSDFVRRRATDER